MSHGSEVKPESPRQSPWELSVAPPPERWDDWTELDAKAWPERRTKHYTCVPTICFNCESACGLLAYVDKETGRIDKFEGNPVHPGSRGRTCAKGPATLNQVHDTERILYPLKRVGKRGAGHFERATWDEALADIGARIRKAIVEERREEVMYHVGRPGEDHFMQRLLAAWGIDGLNTHTNVCSASARTGFALWSGADRPSPDYSEAKFALLLSAHLETGHYFNPHAQRIMSAKERGMRLAVVDTRLSNSASHADLWVSTWPGSEAYLLLAIARELLRRDAAGVKGPTGVPAVNREFVRRWVNWQEYLTARDAGGAGTFERFMELLAGEYDRFTHDGAAAECKIPGTTVAELTDEIVRAEGKFTSHLWRNAASGNLGGWQIARALLFLHVLTGSVGTPGGWNPHGWDKAAPKPSENPGPPGHWNELLFPKEWPLTHYELSMLLPHLLWDQDKRLEVYFTRVYNPVWTNPDGASWIRMLEEDDRIGVHVALTPTWSETAQWADWVLPTGLGPERHDLMSQETHAGTWIGFRQPVLREFARKQGRDVQDSRETNPGEVWEEAELWVALTWAIDPDGALGIRKWYESKERPGQKVSMDEYFGDIAKNVPGLPEAAAKQQLEPLGYLRKYGAFEVPYAGQQRYEKHVDKGGALMEDGSRRAGFATPSGKLEVYSGTLAEWRWPEEALPNYVQSQVHWRALDMERGERCLLPTFRLPTLIHTRSANSKWLNEISHTNPLWVHPDDAYALGLVNDGLVRVETAIGHFVSRVWVTEGIHPGIVACSHHVGRWRMFRSVGGAQLASSLVDVTWDGSVVSIRVKEGAGPFESQDPDTQRVWWKEVGVHQNLTFPVQPDPVSGMHCWHQKVTVSPARDGDRFGDVVVDTAKSLEHYRTWKAKARPAPGPGGLRRPKWLNRPMRPADATWGCER